MQPLFDSFEKGGDKKEPNIIGNADDHNFEEEADQVPKLEFQKQTVTNPAPRDAVSDGMLKLFKPSSPAKQKPDQQMRNESARAQELIASGSKLIARQLMTLNITDPLKKA